jgi:hypothetical protein
MINKLKIRLNHRRTAKSARFFIPKGCFSCYEVRQGQDENK